jgi:dienelactone hydrolase
MGSVKGSLRNSATVAGVVLAFALSVATTAAQAPADNKPVTTPKQVGAWTVIGWSQGYCAAERPVRGAAGGAEALQFVLARVQTGYRIAMSAPQWELAPQTAFPVELIADPVFRSEAKAVAVGPKLVIIELGADGQLVNKIATAPAMEIKAAQQTFKLPMEGFAAALTEVDTCFGALKRPASNPFAAPKAAESKAPATTASETKAAATEAAPKSDTVAPTKVNLVKVEPAAAQPAAATAKAEDDLVEEHTFLTVPNDKGGYRLEALVVRPAKADGRLPIALITHGKNAAAAENQAVRPELFRAQARDFAARGWLAVVVIRRGFGQSDGFPGVSRGSAYMSCGENADLVRGFDTEADDLDGALKALRGRPDADAKRVIAIGQSLGGGTVLAFAARKPAGLLAVINVSGGVWRSNGQDTCDHADLVAAMATFGARTSVPTLWLYSENDSLFPPALVTRMRDAYTQAGGRAQLKMFPPVIGDGHALFMDFAARVKWLRALDLFMQANKMPNTNLARIEDVMNSVQLAAATRPVVEEYFSTPEPKLLVKTASGKGAYWVANQNDIEGARKRVLASCREKSGGECTVVMENNTTVRPIVTGAIEPNTTAR